MRGGAPYGAAAYGGWWLAPADIIVPVVLPSDVVTGDAVWLVEIGRAATLSSEAFPAPVGMRSGAAYGDPARVADAATVEQTIMVSDRGWTGEPDDGTSPNVPYPARLLLPPALESALPVLPEGTRRVSFTVGEVTIANADGEFDSLAGNWSIAGRPVRLLRGPHRRPFHAAYAEMLTVANLRAAGPASGTTRLTIPVTDAGADLAVPVCEIYGGTGGADGVASLEGVPKPRLYGIKRQIEPVFEDTARLIFRLHHGAAISAVLAVRDRGVALTLNGDVASYALLQAAAPASGTYTTCLAEGCIRLGATPSIVTVDARGDVGSIGYSSGTPASLATKLITGPGGISAGLIASEAFADWPVGESGIYLQGGTVAEALDQVAAGIAAWWGVNRYGLLTGARVSQPEDLNAAWDIYSWMLREPPESVVGDDPPRWRARVGFQAVGRVMNGEDLAGSVTAANRELWSKPHQVATRADTAISAAYPLAVDPDVLVSIFDTASDADALALHLLELHGVPRRTWRVPLNSSGIALERGQGLRLTWPRHGLAGGRTLLVRASSLRGDRTEALLWG